MVYVQWSQPVLRRRSTLPPYPVDLFFRGCQLGNLSELVTKTLMQDQNHFVIVIIVMVVVIRRG